MNCTLLRVPLSYDKHTQIDATKCIITKNATMGMTRTSCSQTLTEVKLFRSEMRDRDWQTGITCREKKANIDRLASQHLLPMLPSIGDSHALASVF